MRKLSSFKSVFFICTTLISCFFVVKTANASADHLVISQVQIEGDNSADKANDEFIEIYNPTGQCVSLNNWSLQYVSSTGNYDSMRIKSLPNVFLPPQGYFLAASSKYNGSVAADSTSTNLSLSGDTAGATIFLVNGPQKIATSTDSAIIDKFAYGTSPYNSPLGGPALIPSTTLTGDWAFVRTGFLDDNSLDFTVQPASPRNSASANSGLCDQDPLQQGTSTDWSGLLGIIKISEVLPNPDGIDEGNEAVEIINIGKEAVDLDGWYLDGALDDKDGSKMYQISDQDISPGEFLVITIPTGYFKMYNSSSASTSDVVTLYFPDKTEADSVTYPFSAPEGEGWQNVDDNWMWAPQTLGQENAAPPPPSSGSSGGSSPSAPLPETTSAPTIRITEFLPGSADEKWVELYNSGSSRVNLLGWILDSGSAPGNSSTSALTLDNSFSVAGKSYLVIIIPQEKPILASSSGEIRLLKPGNDLLQSVTYSGTPAGKSCGVDANGKWRYDFPTPGFANVFNVPLPSVVISEILPNPGDEEDEFVEIYNSPVVSGSSTKINLKGFRLRIGTREKVLGATSLSPGSYYVVYEDDLPVNLRNSGQTVVLLDDLSRELSRVIYGKATKGQSLSLSGQSYLWTGLPTPNHNNEIVLGVSTESAKASLVEKDAPKNSQTKELSYAQLYSETKKLNEELSQKMDSLQDMVATLLAQKAGGAAAQGAESASLVGEKSPVKTDNRVLYGIITILAAALLGLLVKQYLWKNPFK